MAVLKRLKASTLMETLVATVLIVILFMVSSLVLNNLFANSILGRKSLVREQLHQLMYEHGHGMLQIPYYGEVGDWEFYITPLVDEGRNGVLFEAKNQRTQQTLGKLVRDAR